MKRIYYILLPLLVSSMTSIGQNTIDSVLAAVAENNSSLAASKAFWESKRLEHKTDLTLANPVVEYDYLNGSPQNAGNQTDFTVTQSFDFPTAYVKKRQLSDERIKQIEFQMIADRQNILLETKLLCIELIYRNKLQAELNRRKLITEKWLRDYQSMMDKGQGTILDVNKAQLLLISMKASGQENTILINQYNQKLTQLNGGITIQFRDTVYSALPLQLDFESMNDKIESNDVQKKYLEQQSNIGLKQLELTKALSLPKFETGYHYQAILGQTFSGVHLGLTIPLWENKNKVKAQEAIVMANVLNLQNHLNEHYFEIKQDYEVQNSLQKTLKMYEELFISLDHIGILNKALKLGEISTIQYFMELSYTYEAYDTYLMTERDYYQSIAELRKFQL